MTKTFTTQDYNTYEVTVSVTETRRYNIKATSETDARGQVMSGWAMGIGQILDSEKEIIEVAKAE